LRRSGILDVGFQIPGVRGVESGECRGKGCRGTVFVRKSPEYCIAETA
jgi:hypothetical protein